MSGRAQGVIAAAGEAEQGEDDGSESEPAHDSS
jgi:hypothetical protein